MFKEIANAYADDLGKREAKRILEQARKERAERLERQLFDRDSDDDSEPRWVD